jgi:hypothetical protein
VPKTRIAKRPVKEKERFFVKLYLEAGAKTDKIAACEKRACLKKGSGRKILARKSVKAEIKAKTEPILSEQMRQSVIGDSYEAAKIAMQRELTLRVSAAKKLKIDKQIIDGVLMQMVLGVNMHLYPKELLDAIKAAYIVSGTLEANGQRLLAPPDPEGGSNRNGSGVYTTLFNRLADPAAPKPQTEVFDLIPPAPKPAVSKTPETIEATEKAATGAPEKEKRPNKSDPRKSDSRVITVEVG